MVRRQMYRWVHPRFAAAREAFETALARLGWKGLPRVRLHPPPRLKAPIFSWKSNFRTPRNWNNSWGKSAA